MNNFKNWNYGEDQFLTDLIKLFSDTYLYIDTIYHFYYINPDSLCNHINQRKNFEDSMKYFYYFNALIKRYQLNNDFMICNLLKFFSMNFKATKNDCTKVDNLIREINKNITNPTKYWERGYKNFVNSYNYHCNNFK